jgi:hypothetical protein
MACADLALVENTQHIGYEENQQYGSEPDAGAATGTPATMAIVPAAATKNQQQNDK